MAARMHVDEIVGFDTLYQYVSTFARACYQQGTLPINNPSIWSLHTSSVGRGG
jgi:hypothetical protein